MIRLARKYPHFGRVFPDGTVPEEHGSVFERSVLIKVLPLGLLQCIGKYFLLSATLLIPVATVASVKALSPLLIVAGYRTLYKVQFPKVTYLLLTPLLAGVIMMIMADAGSGDSSRPFFLVELNSEHIKGLIFCILSTIVMAGQQIYGKQLITWSPTTITNPASLVLNTDPSRPTSPAPGFEMNHNGSSEMAFSHGQPFKGPKKHFLQRNTSIKLPYSTSDLRLDEKRDQRTHYTMEVEENKRSINPFASLASPTPGVKRPDRFTVIFFVSVTGFIFSFSGFLANEAGELLHTIREPALVKGSLQDHEDLMLVFFLVLVNAFSHFCQSVIAFMLLGSIPALSYSIASMMKRIVIIIVSIIFALEATESNSKWFGVINTHQMQGLFLIGMGLYCYDRWGSRSLKENRV